MPTGKTRLRNFVGTIAMLAAAACMDETRVNSICRWSDEPARHLDLTTRADREHLRVDAAVANELMVRYGDAHGPHRPDIARPYRDACMNTLVDSLVARHGITKADITAAEHDRTWWVDILAVFLPMAILTVAVTDRITRRVCRTFEPDDRAIATVSISLLVPIIALLALGVTQFWAFGVEGWLLRDGHVSNRASFIPAVAHQWLAYAGAFSVCAGVAAARFSRTPLTGGRQNQRFLLSTERAKRRLT